MEYEELIYTTADSTVPEPGSEVARLRAVARYQLIGVSPDAGLERIAGVAAAVFSVPMAAVSIVDSDRIWFSATHGLQELRQIARAEGVCNLALADDGVYVVSNARVERRTAALAFVQNHAIGFYAGIAIVSHDGHRLGVLAVMDHQVRSASSYELALLQDLAAIVSDHLELRLSALDALHIERRLRGEAENDRDQAKRDRDSAEHDRDEARRHRLQAQQNLDRAVHHRNLAEQERDSVEDYATVLQRSLLPPALPTIEGLAMQSYYRADSSRQVGGDFFDVFPLGGRRWGFFLGDVVGHGPEAAAVTSLIRYTLRSAALHHRDLTRVLTELNTVLLREAEPRRFCTVLFGTLEPDRKGDGFRITLASGGHPPALLLDPGANTVTDVRAPLVCMLVGCIPNARFSTTAIHLHRGQMLMCYTDGLIETRTNFIDTHLAAFALANAGHGVQHLVDSISELVPSLGPRDDIAVLALQARDPQ